MILTADIGNTRIKRAYFEGDRMVAPGKPERAIVCATGHYDPATLDLGTDRVHLLSSESRLPIAIDYATPRTLGPDRIAAACGAWKLRQESGWRGGCIIVDAGTCITVDWLDAGGVYRGGAILPGLEMKFHALHTFTEKLPLLKLTDCPTQPLTGRSTEESMQAGVLTATRFALEGFVAHYRAADPEAHLLLTGGDADRLASLGLEASGLCSVEPFLTMIGLNEILKINEK